MDEPSDTESEQLRLWAWRAEQLARLGISSATANAAANVVDWHEVAALVENGCPPGLALDIAR